MPVVYQRPDPPPRSYSSHTERTITPVPTDADDSIVLSDLVRTGEASRLRRRGAMRIDHAALASSSTAFPATGIVQQPQQHQQPAQRGQEREPPALIVVRSPTWAPAQLDGEDEGADGEGDRFGTWGVRQTQPPAEYEEWEQVSGGAAAAAGGTRDDEEKAYMLYCGAERDDELEDMHLGAHCGAFRPSILPEHAWSPHATTTTTTRQKRSNGCGALIHARASPRRRMDVWTARGSAEPCVTALDAAYFERAAAAKILRSACGCVREGVGCALCGNPLGTRYRPCQAAVDGLFAGPPSPALAQQRAPMIDSPAYYHPKPSSPQAGSKYMYTFFADAVSSAPPLPGRMRTRVSARPASHGPVRRTSVYTSNPGSAIYAPRPAASNTSANAASRNNSGGHEEQSTGTTYTYFTRMLTASPVPILTPESGSALLTNPVPAPSGARARGVSVYAEQGLDADGEPVEMPGSPDKGAEPTLFPAPER